MGTTLRLLAAAGLGVLGGALPVCGARAGLPEQPGTCVTTSIVQIGNHLVPAAPATPVRPLSGAAERRAGQSGGLGLVTPAVRGPGQAVGHLVAYANAGAQVSAAKLPEIARSLVDDRVQMCLVAEQACPRGDWAGRLYRVTNERTRETWTLPDPRTRCTVS